MPPARSITHPAPVEPLRLHDGRPVLEPDRTHDWESSVVLNPAAVLVENASIAAQSWNLPADSMKRSADWSEVCVMLYRAQGDRDEALGHAPSSLGFAVFTPELRLLYRQRRPILIPESPFERLGIEDPRCTFVDGTYYLYYTGYGSDNGTAPSVRICLATSCDLKIWDKHGPVSGDINDVPNKNAALLPSPWNGRWMLLHRPMSGSAAMTIHLAESESPMGPWRSRGMLMQSFPYREFDRSWIGAGGPPVSLGDGRFLMIYHQGHFTPEGRREYDLAAALLDFRQSDPVVSRIEPLMRPTGALEREGHAAFGVDNVLFTCANYVWRNRVIIPYAGADSRIFGASIDLVELVNALESVDT